MPNCRLHPQCGTLGWAALPMEDPGRVCFLPLPASGGHPGSLACGCLTLNSASMVTQPSPLCVCPQTPSIPSYEDSMRAHLANDSQKAGTVCLIPSCTPMRTGLPQGSESSQSIFVSLPGAPVSLQRKGRELGLHAKVSGKPDSPGSAIGFH